MKKIIRTAFMYLISGVAFEVIFAAVIEMTRSKTVVEGIAPRPLGLTIHTHFLVLGFLFFVLTAVLQKLWNIEAEKPYKLFFQSYNLGLIVSIAVMMYRSFGEVFSFTVNTTLAMAIGTLGHIALTIGLFAFFNCFKRAALSDK